MAAFLRQLWDDLIPAGMRRDPDTLRLANRAAAFHLAMLVWVPVFAMIYYLLGAPISSNIVLSAGVVLLGSLILLRRGMSPTLSGNVICFLAFYTYSALVFFNGGPESPAEMWYVTIPIISLLLSGVGSVIVWTVLTLLAITAFAAARELGFDFPNESTPDALNWLQFTGLTGLVCCVCSLAAVFKRVENKALEALAPGLDPR